ncbi:MAG TPA: hypothetical protein EYP25_07100 [Anaerolineae bacterium]|nr:hypothetical protein [Caldilineae bacterium]HID34322.1 hypothetical protein [Anaerolineae bacterium]HIQ11315.1 hypothetical protein [Caldilineales bacterium]
MLDALRDLSIILLAIESIIIGIILLLLLWQVRLLVILLRDEVKPILKDTQETTRTLRSTTRFVGARVTKPVVNTLSFFAGVRQVVRAMTEPMHPVSRQRQAAPSTRASSASSTPSSSSPSSIISASTDIES